MRDNEFYMYGQNRFSGGNPLQNRAQYGFEMVTSAQYRQFHEMKSQMPSDVLQLFKANEIGFLKAPIKKKCRSLDPVASLSMNLAEMFAIPNLQLIQQEKRQTRVQRIERIAKEKAQKNQQKIEQNMGQWNPFQNPQVSGDPEKTLFVSRLNYKTTQKQLKHQFERYGLIKSVSLARDREGNSRGYAFVEFQNKQDFVHAYKNANQRKISGRRIIVDYERGRTLLKWRPRRFGGGLGDLRLTKEQARKLQQSQRLKRQVKMQRQSKSKSRSRDKKERKNREQQRDGRDTRDIRDGDRDRDHRNKKQKKQKKQKRDKRDKRDYSH